MDQIEKPQAATIQAAKIQGEKIQGEKIQVEKNGAGNPPRQATHASTRVSAPIP